MGLDRRQEERKRGSPSVWGEDDWEEEHSLLAVLPILAELPIPPLGGEKGDDDEWQEIRLA